LGQIQLPSNSTGKIIDTSSLVVAGSPVERENFCIADPGSSFSVANVLNTGLTGTEYGLAVRSVANKLGGVETSAVLAGSATYTGSWHDTTFDGVNSVTVNTFSDKISGTPGLQIQQSMDSSNSNFTQVIASSIGTIAASTLYTLSANITARYWRVVYTNGATAQTTFEVAWAALQDIKSPGPIPGTPVFFEAVYTYGGGTDIRTLCTVTSGSTLYIQSIGLTFYPVAGAPSSVAAIAQFSLPGASPYFISPQASAGGTWSNTWNLFNRPLLAGQSASVTMQSITTSNDIGAFLLGFTIP
jgi:hypothetical protein